MIFVNSAWYFMLWALMMSIVWYLKANIHMVFFLLELNLKFYFVWLFWVDSRVKLVIVVKKRFIPTVIAVVSTVYSVCKLYFSSYAPFARVVRVLQVINCSTLLWFFHNLYLWFKYGAIRSIKINVTGSCSDANGFSSNKSTAIFVLDSQ